MATVIENLGSKPLLKGRPKRLFVLDFGLFRVHSNGRTIGICGYLVQTGAGENVLIDSGFPAKYAANPEHATAEDRLHEFGEIVICTPENLPQAQLARIGLTADDIDYFVLTHTHIDHVGSLADFPRAPIILSKPERDLPRPLYWSEVQPIDWPERRYLTIEADTAIGPGFDLLMAPGHTPGQIAALVDLPQTGSVLLTSDAISRPDEIAQGFDTAPDPVAARQSARRILDLAQSRKAMVIYGHCPAQWPELKKAPDFYS